MNNTPNQHQGSSPSDEWQDLLETPEVMSSSTSPSSRNIPTPTNYPWEIDSSSSSSSSSQKLILILKEDGYSKVADQSGKKYNWAWSITKDGQVRYHGHDGENDKDQTAQWVGDNVNERPGITDRVGAPAGQEVTFTFASRDENGVWRPNGWVLTAKKYEVLGVSDEHLQGLNDYKKIPPEAKPITRETIYGMTTFLTSKLGEAKDPGYAHWYMIKNE